MPRLIQVQSVINKSKVVIKTRRIIVLLSSGGRFVEGNPVVLKIGRPIGYLRCFRYGC